MMFILFIVSLLVSHHIGIASVHERLKHFQFEGPKELLPVKLPPPIQVQIKLENNSSAINIDAPLAIIQRHYLYYFNVLVSKPSPNPNSWIWETKVNATTIETLIKHLYKDQSPELSHRMLHLIINDPGDYESMFFQYASQTLSNDKHQTFSLILVCKPEHLARVFQYALQIIHKSNPFEKTMIDETKLAEINTFLATGKLPAQPIMPQNPKPEPTKSSSLFSLIYFFNRIPAFFVRTKNLVTHWWTRLQQTRTWATKIYPWGQNS